MAKGKKTGGKNWVKGQSGNPNGAPVLPWNAAVRKAVGKRRKTGTGQKKLVQDIMVDSMIDETIKGNVAAFNALTDRMDGKPQENANLSGQVTLINKIELLEGEDVKSTSPATENKT